MDSPNREDIVRRRIDRKLSVRLHARPVSRIPASGEHVDSSRGAEPDRSSAGRIKQLDREIAEDWANGYGPDVDEKLERRLELKRQIDRQHAA
jgi:hypothetical protein